MLLAKCSCGFESEKIYAGGGFLNCNESCGAPALCQRCNLFVVKNYLKIFCRCPQCKKKVLFYDDPSLQKGPPINFDKEVETDSVFSWNMHDKNKLFILPNTYYFCPECGKFAMTFEDVGDWD